MILGCFQPGLNALFKGDASETKELQLSQVVKNSLLNKHTLLTSY